MLARGRSGFLAVLLTAPWWPSPASAQSQELAVLQTVQRLVSAISARDTAALHSILTPEGRFTIIGTGPASTGPRTISHAEFIEIVASSREELLERVWDPQVLLDGDMAVVWAPYDFYRGGEFSHCGTDAFTLASFEQGWRITGGSYTVQRSGCTESPLGPPATERSPPEAGTN